MPVFGRALPGRDGAVWFVEQDGNKLGRITTARARPGVRVPMTNLHAEYGGASTVSS